MAGLGWCTPSQVIVLGQEALMRLQQKLLVTGFPLEQLLTGDLQASGYLSKIYTPV